MITFNIASFRVSFPAFSSTTTYPDATLQESWDVATLYITNSDYGYLSGAARTRAINLMAAHITKLSDLLASGRGQQMVITSKVAGLELTRLPPPVKSQMQWWMGLSEYGTQLIALISRKGVGGMYFCGVRTLR